MDDNPKPAMVYNREFKTEDLKNKTVKITIEPLDAEPIILTGETLMFGMQMNDDSCCGRTCGKVSINRALNCIQAMIRSMSDQPYFDKVDYLRMQIQLSRILRKAINEAPDPTDPAKVAEMLSGRWFK